MCRSFLYGNREVPRPASSARNACCSGPHREGEEPKSMMHDRGKSDSAIVAVKPTNNAGEPAAEPVEPRAGTKRNAGEQSTHRTQGRTRVTQALARVRKAAQQRRKEKFTALFHHLSVDLLREAFLVLKRDAADAWVGDPMLDETDQPTLADFVEKGSNVRVKNEVHLLVGDPDRQSVQRIVLAALRPEAIAEPEEVFLVNAVQHRDGRSLDDLVFERRHRQRPLSPVRLRNVRPA